MTSEGRGRSRKHKLSSQEHLITSDGTCSNRACNSWEESASDEINSYFCHQLSSLSIPKSGEYPPRKKLKRRKNRKVKRSRVANSSSKVHISESSDVTPTSPAGSHLIASDDTVQEAMSVGDASSDSSLSLERLTDLGGTEADDELSCWEGPVIGACSTYLPSSGEDNDMASAADQPRRSKRRMGNPVQQPRINTDLSTSSLMTNVLARREKLKTPRQRSQTTTRETYHGGSSTSSPSMTGKDNASIRRRYIGMGYAKTIASDGGTVPSNPGPSSAMHTGD